MDNPIKTVLTKLLPGSEFQRYFSNTAWLMVQRSVSLLLALAVSIWTARHLGPADFGLLMFAVNFATIFTTITPLGLPRILERDLARDQDKTRTFIATAFYLVAIGAACVFLAIIVVASLRPYDTQTLILIAVVGLSSFLQVYTVLESYYLSNVQGKKLASINFIALLFSNSIKIIFIIFDAPLILFAFSFVLDWLLVLPLVLRKLRHSDAFPRIRDFSHTSARYLLSQSWPFILTGLFITLYMKIDVVMIRDMLGDERAGQYSAAIRLSTGFYFVALTIITSLYPAIVNAKKQNETLYIDRMGSLYAWMFYSAIAISIIFTIASTSLVNFLYGERYSDAASVLAIHVWSSAFVFLGMSSTRWLLTENLQKYQILNTAIGATVNIGLNALLIPRYGIEGAAFATILSYGISGYFCFALWKSTRSNFYLMTKSCLQLKFKTE